MSEIQKQNTGAVAKPSTVKDLLASEKVQERFKEMLGKRATAFMTSIAQISQANLPATVDASSVINAAITAATLDLPINNQLGLAYIVSYKAKQKDGSYKDMAQFQMGYRSYIQLAQRTGLYKSIGATEVYEGQFLGGSELDDYEFDFTKRDSNKIIGYAASFKLLNGFTKNAYMTAEQMNEHAKKYSKNYSADSSLWKKDPIGMGKKTVIKLLLSKYGPLSVDQQMQMAIQADQSVQTEEGEYQYVDAPEPETPEVNRMKKLIDDCQTKDELKALLAELDMDEETMEYFEQKMDTLTNKK
jgi:recombination protein RecT